MIRYPKGISRSATGWRISLGPGGKTYRRHFPPSTPQATVETALLNARKTLARDEPAHDGSLASEMQRYLLDHYTGKPGYDERDRHLSLWLVELGPQTQRDAITRDDVARVLNNWRASGLGADTCNKRRTALLALFNTLDGKGGSNPVRDVPKFRPPDPMPRGLAYDQIDKALRLLPACRTRARLSLMAYTGIRPAQMMRLTMDHWDHKNHVLTVPGTRKGHGTRPYVIPLCVQAREAMTEFDSTNAWGTFTWAPIGRMWREAWLSMLSGATRSQVRAHPELYAHITTPVVYDLRHSFGTEAYRATGDLKAVKDLLGHASMRMSERYTLAAVPAQRLEAVQKFGARIALVQGAKVPPASAKTRGSLQQRRTG